MLMLVMGGNLLLLLVGWGLVGLASYLLIGFYHDRPEAVAAAKKAFVVNAIGELRWRSVFFLLIAKTGSLDFLDDVRRCLQRPCPRAPPTSSPSPSSPVRSRSPRSCPSTRGSRTRWKGRRRSRR